MISTFFHGFSDELSKLGSVPPKIVELLKRPERLLADKLESSTFGSGVDHPSSKRFRYFGAYEEDGSLVGMIRANTDPLRAWKGDDNYEKIKALNPDVAISAMAVRPEYRRKGIARLLRNRIKDEYNSILTGISTSYSNVPAMERLNEEMGFKEVLERAGGKNRQYHWKRPE